MLAHCPTILASVRRSLSTDHYPLIKYGTLQRGSQEGSRSGFAKGWTIIAVEEEAGRMSVPKLIRLSYGTETPGTASVRITDLIICRPEIAAYGAQAWLLGLGVC